MKLQYQKGFDGDLSKLPSRKVEGAVPFKEPKSLEKLSIIGNIIAIIIIFVACIPVIIVSGGVEAVYRGFLGNLLMYTYFLVFMLVMFPLHELLHAVCFRGEVKFYAYLSKGMLFVVGTESFSKIRFIFMCLLPNLVFGFVPYILFFIFPSQIWLGFIGVFCIGAGAGDYINVFNALTQMPKGAKCFMNKNRTYWYIDN